MKYNRLSLSILLFTIVSTTIFSLAPPPPPPPGAIETVEDENLNPSISSWFIDMQSKGATYINKLLKELREGFHPVTFITVIAFSLAYGIFHTIGPGHGKLIVVSYFMQRERTVKDALILSIIISLIHASGAIILAVLFRTVLSGIQSSERMVFQFSFTMFSGLLLTSLGLFFLIKKLTGKRTHQHNEITIPDYYKTKGIWRRNLAAGFSIGVVPCPLSLTIMMISIVSGIFWVGLTSVIALTIAMVTVLFGISYYTIKTRNLTTHSNKMKKNNFKRILAILLSYLGTASMIILGIYICYKGVLGITIWKS